MSYVIVIIWHIINDIWQKYHMLIWVSKGPLQSNLQLQSCQKFIFTSLIFKIKNVLLSFVFSGISFVFTMWFGPDEDHDQINQTLGTCYLYIWLWHPPRKSISFAFLIFLTNTTSPHGTLTGQARCLNSINGNILYRALFLSTLCVVQIEDNTVILSTLFLVRMQWVFFIKAWEIFLFTLKHYY